MRDMANSSIPLRTQRMLFADTAMPLLRLLYSDITKDITAAKPYCALTIDANGSGASKLILFLDVGASATDYTQYQFSAHSAAAADPRGIDSSPTHTQVTTLKALIAALRALNNTTDEIGIRAFRLNAPADYSLDTDDFKDLAVTNVTNLNLDCLYKDASEVLTCAMRIGVPDNVDGEMGRGRMSLHRIVAFANSASATDCEMKISRDPDDVDESKEVVLAYTKYVPDATVTEMYDFTKGPTIEQGPLLIEITATSSLAENAYVDVAFANAEI